MSVGFTDFGSLCCASLSDFFMIVHTGSMGPGCGMAAKGRGEFWAFRDLRGQKKKKKKVFTTGYYVAQRLKEGETCIFLGV